MSPLNPNNHPIGVFDSGLGGLTVVKEIMRRLPQENIIYFGDTARVPYGTKSKESIIRFSQENVLMLIKHKVKMVIIACNTSSSVALEVLKRSFAVPVMGVIEPGARKAVDATRNKRVGVIGTLSTIKSEKYLKTIQRLDSSVEVFSQPCPLFVPLAEEGWFAKKTTFAVAREYLAPLKKARVDTLILGCTHYPLLKRVIQKVMGPQVTLIDSAGAVVEEVKQFLKQHQKGRITHRHGQHLFLVSDEPKHFHHLAKRFLGHAIKNVKRSPV
jgi:glutamate racemase